MNNYPLLSRKTLSSYLSNYMIFIILVFIILLMSIAQPGTFLTVNNLVNIVRQMVPIGLIALGVSFTITSGGIDLSSSALVAVAACISGLMMQKGSAIPLFAAILAVLLVGIVVGWINGFIITNGHVTPFIATLGMALVCKGMALVITGGMPLSGFSPGFRFIGSGNFILPIPIIIFIIMIAISYLMLHKSKFGSYIFAVGGNENAAKVSGVDINKTRIWIYVFAGFMSALAGLILSARTAAALSSYGEGFDLDAISAAVIGGTSFAGGQSRVLGTIAGVLIIGLISNCMTVLHIDVNWQQVFKGLIILIAVLIDERKGRIRL